MDLKKEEGLKSNMPKMVAGGVLEVIGIDDHVIKENVQVCVLCMIFRILLMLLKGVGN